jgi:hypothetical protein
MMLTIDKWTTVAHRGLTGSGVHAYHVWRWVEGVQVKTLHEDVAADRVILMHRHSPEGVELVARVAGPAWRRLRRSITERRGKWA